MKGCLACLLLLCGVLIFPSLNAADFTVVPTGGNDCSLSGTTNCTFQSALSQASGNSENNTITMAGGTYTGPFLYSKTLTVNSLVIQHDSEDLVPTVIEYSGGTALKIDSAFAVEVSHITFQNSVLGLNVIAWGFNIDADHPNEMNIHDCEFSTNRQGLKLTSSMVDFSLTGKLTLTHNNFHDNNHDEMSNPAADIDGAGLRVNFVTVHAFPATLTNNTFTDNEASVDGRSGGGAYIAMYGSGSSVTMTGNTFKGNQANQDGGGAYVETHYDPDPIVLKGNTFGGSGDGEGNTAGRAGGGILLKTYDDNSSITVGGELDGEGNTFIKNVSNTVVSNDGEGGGGLAARASGLNSSLSLIDNTFQDNTSYWGGGFQIDTDSSGGFITVTGNTLSGNTANVREGGGGHIWASYGLSFQGNTLTENHSTASVASAGGIAIDIDGNSSNTFSHTIANNSFLSNSSLTTGGGLAINPRANSCNCNITLNANLFVGNTAATEGGGAWVYMKQTATPLVVTNNIFANANTANNGAGFYIYNALENTTGTDFINNTLFANNANLKGGGAYFDLWGAAGTLNSYNNIFWSDTAVESDEAGSDVFAFYGGGSTLAFNNNDRGQICVNVSSVVTCDASNSSNTIGANNINADPDFFTTEHIPTGLRLLSTSPAAGTGDPDAPGIPTEDYAGNSFPTSPIAPAMGAYQDVLSLGMSVSPSSKDYGFVLPGSSSSQVFTISNTGLVYLYVSSLVLSDTTNFTLHLDGGDNPCAALNASVCSAEVHTQCSAFTIPSGQSCTISVDFNPTVAQNISGELLISSNAPSVSIPLSGTANSSASAISMSIQGPSGNVEVGNTAVFEIQLTNNSGSDSENNTLNLTFENMEFESGSEANASATSQLFRALRWNDSSSVFCSGSGSTATCSIARIAANSTLTLNINAKVTAVGTLSLTANLTNQAGTATASGIATATGISPSSLNGAGCSLNKSDSRNYFSFWMFASLILIPMLRVRKNVRS